MRRITILSAAVVILLVAAAAWWYRAPLLAQFGLGAAEAESMAEVDHSQMDHSQHDMAPTPASEQAGERKVLYWYDPMHPAYKSDKPGTAPDCGMNLVPRYADEVEAMKDMPAGSVMLSSEKQQLIGVRTAEVRRERLTRTLRTVAIIAADETRLSHAHTKVEGWIEDVFVDYVGAPVHRGDPLFTIYSPELLATQQEYLIAMKARRELADSPTPEVARSAEALYQAARQRLRLWDVTEEQIRRLEETGQPQRALTVYAEHDGIVTERKALPHMRVEKNTDLYTLVDLSRVWAMAEVYEYEASFVEAGQTGTMRLSYGPGKSYAGKVTYVYPTLDPSTRTIKVRLEFPNPNFELKPDMYADVELQIDYGVQTLVPAEAVLDSGVRQIVFLAKPGGFFVPQEIKVGARLEGQVVVLAGLKPGDTIVTSGNFLIDSESRLSSATGGMSHSH